MSKSEASEDFAVSQTGRGADLLASFIWAGGVEGNKEGKLTSLSFRYVSRPEGSSGPQAVYAGVTRINCFHLTFDASITDRSLLAAATVSDSLLRGRHMARAAATGVHV